MAAEPLELIGAGGEAGVQVEARHGAAGALPTVALSGNEHDRAAEPLDESRGHDPDHTFVPALTPDDVRATVALLGRPGLDGRDRFAENPVLDRLAVAIEALELVGEQVGLADVIREDEVQRDIGAPEAPCGVDPRREPERDCGRIDRRRIDAGNAHQRCEPGLLRAGEAAEARGR